MPNSNSFDVLIIGGSYAGLSAAMALGRSVRRVLVIDSGEPCNQQTPHSHNFLTRDGEPPAAIAKKARAQVSNYPTVEFFNGLAVQGEKLPAGFQITTGDEQRFTAPYLLFASGLKDVLPPIEGMRECWGISVIHCPYCHGYEVRGQKTGILANGDFAIHYAQLVRNLTTDLTIFTNGKAEFSQEQWARLQKHGIDIAEDDIKSLKHESGRIQEICFADGSGFELDALYLRPQLQQHCLLPQELGCELTDQGLLKVDFMQQTTVSGIFACGDNAHPMRSVAGAVASGNLAGAAINSMLSAAEFAL